MYESNRESLKKINDDSKYFEKAKQDSPLGKTEKEYSELADIFPALEKYKDDHNIANLQKLCVEISEFCRSVYASTRNEQERKVYFAMIQKLNK